MTIRIAHELKDLPRFLPSKAGRSESLFNAPPASDPVFNLVRGKASYSRPFWHAFGFPVVGVSSCCSSVHSLFGSSGPSAITWFIIPIYIYSVYGMLATWPISHISVKVGELFPLVAYGYTSTAIVLIGLVMLVCASLNHRIPNVIDGGFEHPVSDASFSGYVADITPTANRFTADNVTRGYNFFIPAVTEEKPLCCSVWPSRVTDGSQHSEPLPGNIDELVMLREGYKVLCFHASIIPQNDARVSFTQVYL